MLLAIAPMPFDEDRPLVFVEPPFIPVALPSTHEVDLSEISPARLGPGLCPPQVDPRPVAHAIGTEKPPVVRPLSGHAVLDTVRVRRRREQLPRLVESVFGTVSEAVSPPALHLDIAGAV